MYRFKLGEIFANHTADKGPTSAMHKEDLNSTVKQKIQFRKKEQKIWTAATPKKLYKHKVSTQEMLNIICHQGNVNWKYSEIQLYIYYSG